MKQPKSVYSKALTGDVLPAQPENPDVALVTADGSRLAEFVRGVREFLSTAATLEKTAVAQLAVARSLALPTTKDEDLAVQRFVVSVNRDKKAIEEHWTITAVVSRFHRALTSMRKAGTDAADEAARIGNQLHQQYETKAIREAEAAQRRKDAEAEQLRQQLRDQELAQMEQAAVDAEEKSQSLSERELAFVSYIVVDGLKPQAAAQRAGFKDGLKSAARLMSMPKIHNAIEAKREAIAIRKQAEAVKVSPLDPVHIDEVKPDVARAPGVAQRTYYSGEVLNEGAFIAAAISGQYGIPQDCLTINTTKLNQYAKDMKLLINRWPGVRLKADTRVS